MFGAYVYEISSAEYETDILLIDEDRLEEKTGRGKRGPGR